MGVNPPGPQPTPSATIPIPLLTPAPPAPEPALPAAPRRGVGLGRAGQGCLLAVLVLALLALVVPSATTLWRQVSTLTSAAPTPTSTSSHPTSAAPTPTTSTTAPAALTMPSGNITCWHTGSGVRCTITEHGYATPVAPAACRGATTWGKTVDLVHTRAAALTCPPAAAGRAPRGAVLPYGRSRTLGTATCTSTTSYVECKDGPHGLRLARAGYRVW